MRTIASFGSEGYMTTFREDDDRRIFGLADLDIDADGANGQNGSRAAYMVEDKGWEYLANGGMRWDKERQLVLPKEDWWQDIVIHENGRPKEFPGGIIASKTAYRFKGLSLDDPGAYVDSATVAYIVVQRDIIARTSGAVLGCAARCTLLATGVKVDCIVGDVGPRSKIGEGSMRLASAIGLNSSPKSGGIDYPGILFEIWPGVHGTIGGKKIPLLRSDGEYIEATP